MKREYSHALAFVLALSAAQAHAMEYRFTALGGGFGNAIALDINNNNQVVGVSGQSPGPLEELEGTPTIWTGGTLTAVQASDSTMRYVSAINSAGQVAGRTVGADGWRYHAAIWSDGKNINLAVPGGYARGLSVAYDINDHGQVVGSGDVSMDSRHALTWDRDGNVTDLTPGNNIYASSNAYAINNHGDIAGYTSDAGNTRAVIWSNGTPTLLSSLKDEQSAVAYGINEHGEAVGSSTSNSPHTAAERAVYWKMGRAIKLGTLGGRNSRASAINDRGDIVGWAQDQFGDQQATLWVNGKAIDLQEFAPENWYLQTATSINDKGVIVGYASEYHPGWGLTTGAFMLTPVAPVPEAETYAMMAAGFAMFGLMRRRERASRAA
jgi:probable HAF family extracellular repeat protein